MNWAILGGAGILVFWLASRRAKRADESAEYGPEMADIATPMGSGSSGGGGFFGPVAEPVKSVGVAFAEFIGYKEPEKTMMSPVAKLELTPKPKTLQVTTKTPVDIMSSSVSLSKPVSTVNNDLAISRAVSLNTPLQTEALAAQSAPITLRPTVEPAPSALTNFTGLVRR